MTEQAERQTSPVSSTARTTGILAVLLTGQFVANVDTAIVNIATPSIQESIGASGAQLELVVSGYVLSYAALLITGARLGDLFGYRRLFVIGLAVFTCASLACGLALNPGTLIAARIIQGAGAALMVPQVLIGIQRSLPSSRRPKRSATTL